MILYHGSNVEVRELKTKGMVTYKVAKRNVKLCVRFSSERRVVDRRLGG